MNIWNGNGSHLEKRIKSMMIDFLCRLQDENCLTSANKEYAKIPNAYFTNPDNTTNG